MVGRKTCNQQTLSGQSCKYKWHRKEIFARVIREIRSEDENHLVDVDAVMTAAELSASHRLVEHTRDVARTNRSFTHASDTPPLEGLSILRCAVYDPAQGLQIANIACRKMGVLDFFWPDTCTLHMVSYGYQGGGGVGGDINIRDVRVMYIVFTLRNLVLRTYTLHMVSSGYQGVAGWGRHDNVMYTCVTHNILRCATSMYTCGTHALPRLQRC